MLEAADVGFLFRPPQNVIDEFPQFKVFTEYNTLLAEIDAAEPLFQQDVSAISA